MPSPSPTAQRDRVLQPAGEFVERIGLAPILSRCRTIVTTVAFWTAIVLPAAYLPLLAAARLEQATVLAATQAAMLLVGHSYGDAD